MGGSKNDVVVGKNADFSQAGAPNATTSEANGLATNGQMWIGTTALNAGGTHVNVGNITSPNSSLTIGYSSPNITLQVTGGSTVGQTITGDSGGALSPTAGNWNILGSGSITTAGAGSTLTTQLTGLTNHAVLVGAGTSTITKVGPVASTGAVLQSNGVGSDPGFSTATYPSTTTINQVLYSSANNVVGGITAANNGTMISGTTGVPSWLANGTTGQILTATTGSPPSWAASGGFASVVIQFFNAGTPTYTPTSGMKFCIVEVIGGGGGGGGANTTGAGQVSCGGGGGAGGYARGVFTAAEIGGSVSITVGALGTAGTSGGGTGGTGGTTIFGALINAAGGVGGVGGGTAAIVSTTLGGAGGVGSQGTGDFASNGASGTNGAGSFAAGFVKAGTGGSSVLGGGGTGACINTGRAAGASGTPYGGGGGGSAAMAGQTGFAGGSGSIGCVIVTEFI